MQEIQTVFMQVVLPGLGALLLSALFVLARHYAELIKDERIRAIVEDLVKAAEQLFGSGKGATNSDKKLEFVLDGLKEKKINAGGYQIEAAVRDVNEWVA